jgi:RND family efflux transporter MFP subunit
MMGRLLIGLTIVTPSCGRAPPPLVNEPLVSVVAAEVVEAAPAATAVRGEVGSRARLELGFRTAGIVRRVKVRTGDRVRRGDVLATLDAADVAARLRAATATAAFVDREHERTAVLARSGALAPAEAEHSEYELERANASVALARDALSAIALTAPVDGTVVRQVVDPGEVVAPGAPVLVVEESGRLVFRMGVSRIDVERLKPGTVLSLRTSDGVEGTVSVSTVAPSPDPTTNLYAVEAALKDSASSIAPGTLAYAMVGGGRTPLAQIPADAIVHGSNGDRVCVLEYGADGRTVARWRAITIQRIRGPHAWVGEGVHAGEKVVGEGAYFLRDGQFVNVVAP